MLLGGGVEGMVAVFIRLFGVLIGFLLAMLASGGKGVKEVRVGESWEEVLTVVSTAAVALLVLGYARVPENVVHLVELFFLYERGVVDGRWKERREMEWREGDDG